MEAKDNDLSELDLIFLEFKEKKIFNFTKRIMDILLSLIGVIVLIPITIIIAVIIKIDDPNGKVFFSQIRVGKNQKEFKMYKFRSMYSNAEEKLADILQYNEVHGAMFKMKEDPRITKTGKYLRKFSLDELPQLINVLKGDMSLIGPRPPLINEIKQYSTYDKQRLLIKPGITGLWQVNGRNALTFDEMVVLDLKYIKEQSFFMDIQIFFKTFIVVLKSSNAY